MGNKTSKPTKQRKMLFQALDHRRGKILSSHLASSLKSSYKARAVPVRTGDTVRVLRGDHKGFEGKITKVNRKEYRIFIEGMTHEKSDGTTVPVPIHPSKVEVVRLDVSDKIRKEILKRRGAVEEVKKPAEETPEKAEAGSPKEQIKSDSTIVGGT